ncbi:MAG: hypothetical protein ACRDJ3_05050 [Solirubrobacteraceae bacterium]
MARQLGDPGLERLYHVRGRAVMAESGKEHIAGSGSTSVAIADLF